MNRKILCTIAVLAIASSALVGCGAKQEEQATVTTSTQQPVAKQDPVISLFNEYAVMEGHTLYQSPDGGFSIQLPEGSTMNDSDPNNVTINIASAYANPDLINISKTTGAQKIDSTAGLMEMLKNDNSIDITGFFVLNKDNAYEGYKYTYVSVDNSELKGIVSTFFAEDGSAYIVNATINNGGDEANVQAVNDVIDTFVNYL